MDEQVQSERRQTEQLLIQIERERNLRIKSEMLVEEERMRSQTLYKKMKEEQQKEEAFQKKKQEIEGKVGVPVKVRRICRLGVMTRRGFAAADSSNDHSDENCHRTICKASSSQED